MTDAETKTRYITAIKKAKRSLVDYRHIMLTHGDDECRPAPFHFDWSDTLLNGSGNDAIEGFRESGKTQYVIRSFLLYSLQFPSTDRDYIVLIKKNARLASAKLKEIQKEYATNPAISSNCQRVVEESADVFSVDVKDAAGKKINIRIEAYGKGASIRGLANIDRRPKIVIIDDPQDVEDSTSPTVQQTDWDWFLSDVMFLGQKTRIFLIGNNLGEASIIERVGANANELSFSFKRIPAIHNDRSAWPDKFTVKDIEKEKENFRKIGKIDIWLREKMCLAISDETRIFKKSDFRYFTYLTHPKIEAESNAFITVDPASSLSDDSDYRAVVCNLVNPENQWFIIEISYGRYDTVKFFDELFRMVVQWNVTDVGIEEGIYKQAIQPFLDKEMRKRNQFFNVVTLKHGRARKEERIKLLQPRFTTHSIFFPDTAEWLPELESELLAFTMKGTKGLHDDLIDALAYQEQIIRVPFKPTPRNNNLPREAITEYQIL